MRSWDACMHAFRERERERKRERERESASAKEEEEELQYFCNAGYLRIQSTGEDRQADRQTDRQTGQYGGRNNYPVQYVYVSATSPTASQLAIHPSIQLSLVLTLKVCSFLHLATATSLGSLAWKQSLL